MVRELSLYMIVNSVDTMYHLVAIDYNRFKPSGNGYIILRSPEFMERNLRLLQNTTVGGFRISALPSNDPDSQSRLSQRTRGAKGKAEAAHRGLLTGDGPGGGVTGGGKHVILSGLPGKMNADSVRVWLKNYKFANDGSGDVVKLDLPANHMSLMSKHFVRLANASEAHRLARTLHMTFFQQDVWDTKYLIKARVVH